MGSSAGVAILMGPTTKPLTATRRAWVTYLLRAEEATPTISTQLVSHAAKSHTFAQILYTHSKISVRCNYNQVVQFKER